eukprot:6145501-Pyramimonas_sp.AAC.2
MPYLGVRQGGLHLRGEGIAALVGLEHALDRAEPAQGRTNGAVSKHTLGARSSHASCTFLARSTVVYARAFLHSALLLSVPALSLSRPSSVKFTTLMLDAHARAFVRPRAEGRADPPLRQLPRRLLAHTRQPLHARLRLRPPPKS